MIFRKIKKIILNKESQYSNIDNLIDISNLSYLTYNVQNVYREASYITINRKRPWSIDPWEKGLGQRLFFQ